MPLTRLDLVTAVGDACDLGNGAVFVGAGLSKAAGLPDWADLLETPRVKSNVPSSPETRADLPLLAEYILAAGELTRGHLEQHILEMVSAADAYPTEMHVSLARLPVDQIWTTNYDPLIERASPDAQVIGLDDDIQRIGTARKVIVKMHGSIAPGPPARWIAPPVITRSDFEVYEAQHRRTWAMLQASYLSKTFLFLGFSFSDPNVGILQRLSRIHGTATSNRHVAVMRRPDDSSPDEQRLHDLRVLDLEDSGVHVHEIDAFDELQPILTALVRRTRPPRLFIAGSDKGDVDHRACCDAVARELADRTSWELCSLGGHSGWRTTQAVARIQRSEGTYDASSLVFHFRRSEARPPEMDERVGTAVFTDLEREPLVTGLLEESRAALVISGGERTMQEIGWATDCGVGVVPLAISGGAARAFWEQHRDTPPDLGGAPTDLDTWRRLGNENLAVASRAAARLLDQAMYAPRERGLGG